MEGLREALKDCMYVDYLLRILLALVLGFCIGFERKSRAKEAGIRTHALVAVGAALFTIISKYGFTDLGDVDGARIAAQIVAGVGFLGAGMIMHQRQVIHGLTTAAGIWATAGVGMAAAAGLWEVAIGTTVLMIGVQVLLHANIKFFLMKRYYSYKVNYYESENAQVSLRKIFGVEKFSRLKIEKREEELVSVATIRTEKDIPDSEISKIISENEFIISMESFSSDTE